MQHIGRVAGRMAGGIDGLNAGQHFHPGRDHGHLVGDRFEPGLGADNEGLALLRGIGERVVGEPVIPFGLRYPVLGFGE